VDYFLGIDVGTSGLKAVLVNKDGSVTGTSTSEYEMYTPRPLWAEQNPGDWWKAAGLAIKSLISDNNLKADEIKGVGLTGQMHGLVTLDEKGDVLYPCIMWNDQRTGEECREITEEIGSDRLLEITGNQVLPGFTAPKIIWLRKNKSDVYSKIKKVLLPKDYLRYKMTGEFFSEVSDASGTSLLDVKNRRWSDEMLKKLDIPREWLPEVRESIEVTGNISAEAASATGLTPGTPVVGGGGDQAAGAVGAGAVREGIISLVLGTSGVVFTHSDQYRIEPEGKLHAFCHSVPGAWHLMGVTLSAAGSLKWYRDKLYPGEKYDSLTKGASGIQAGSEGLLFLPYLSGERTPYPDPQAKGTFTGITLRHGKDHFTRAILEGVAYSLRDCYELNKSLGIKADKIIASGGGARSPLWRSIISDLFNLEITTLKCTEGAPYGAAIMAAVGTGYYNSINEACDAMLEADTVTSPDNARSNVYDDFYDLYRELYPTLKESFKKISKTVDKHYGG
jgi:xylulokinase